MTIDKIGPKTPKPGGVSETSSAGAEERKRSIGKSSFSEELKSLPVQGPGADALSSIVEEASRKIGAGEMVHEQAIDYILEAYREELVSKSMDPGEIDHVIAFVKEVVTDDPTVRLLLGAAPEEDI